MRRLLLAMYLSAGLDSGAFAQGAEIEANISAQIQAFKADDFATAFYLCQPQYSAPVPEPREFRGNGTQRLSDGLASCRCSISGAARDCWYLWQKVMIVDGDGRVHILDYQMVQQENGWKINGVQLLGNSDPSA